MNKHVLYKKKSVQYNLFEDKCLYCSDVSDFKMFATSVFIAVGIVVVVADGMCPARRWNLGSS